jgi:hypothetical protein
MDSTGLIFSAMDDHIHPLTSDVAKELLLSTL